METNLTKTGGSLYIRIPYFIVDTFNLKPGDRAEIIMKKSKVIFIIENQKKEVI